MSQPPQPQYYSFTTKDVVSISEVGGKAKALIETKNAGFNVPAGFVLTVDFFSSWIETIQKSNEWESFIKFFETVSSNDDIELPLINEKCESIKNAVQKILTLSENQKQALEDAISTSFISTTPPPSSSSSSPNNPLFAVRSSSPEEDLDGASFAGGYETTLAVSKQDISDAIRSSFASLFDGRVVLYKMQKQMSVTNPKIAVIVQQQVTSEKSGVAFSLNPLTNSYDDVVINANYGLGDTIVSGTVTPDNYVVDKLEWKVKETSLGTKEVSQFVRSEGAKVLMEVTNSIEKTGVSCLTKDEIIAVAKLAGRVEEHYGKPMDIEWAICGDELFLLQARPITAYLSLFPEMMTDPGVEKMLYLDMISSTQGFSDCMSILGLELFSYFVNVLKPNLKTVDKSKEAVAFTINGRWYLNLSILGGAFGYSGLQKMLAQSHDGAVQSILEEINMDEYSLSKKTHAMRDSFWTTLAMSFSAIPCMIHSYFFLESAIDNYKKESKIIFEKAQKLSSAEVQMSFPDAVRACGEIVEKIKDKVYFLVVGLLARWRLSRCFTEEDNAQSLLSSLEMDLKDNPTSLMGHLMCELAAFPEVQETQTGGEFERKMNSGELSESFMDAYHNYMNQFGCRCIREIDISAPRPRENISFFFSQLKQIDINDNAAKTSKKRRQEAYDKLLSTARHNRKEHEFVAQAKILQQTLGYREDPKYLIVAITDVLRTRALRLATIFKKQNRIDSISDIFHLHVNDIGRAEVDDTLDLRPLISSNSQPQIDHRYATNNWPIVFDSRGTIFRAQRRELSKGEYECDPISPGVVRGVANVLRAPYDKPLRRGEILVTKATNPGWTPIFVNAGAVVLEVGGSLQHGAVLAREYGLPCVSGLVDAVELIKDGQLIEVDGSRGIVRLIDDFKEDEEV